MYMGQYCDSIVQSLFSAFFVWNEPEDCGFRDDGNFRRDRQELLTVPPGQVGGRAGLPDPIVMAD